MMQRINLYPWREEQRRTRKLRFFILVIGVTVFSTSIQMFIYWHYHSLLLNSRWLLQQRQEEQVSFTQSLGQLDDENEKQQISYKNSKTVLGIKKSKYAVVTTLGLLPLLIPDDLFLNELTIINGEAVLSGMSTDMQFISVFAEALKSEKAFSKVEIESISSSREGSKHHHFTLSFRLL